MRLAEWLYEAGIGEARAALVAEDVILEAIIERDDASPRGGAIVPARLIRQLIPRRRGIAVTDGGDELLLEPLPPGVSEGATLLVEIVREVIPEPGRAKRAKARPAPDGACATPGASLIDRIAATGLPVITLPAHGADRLEAAGWSELIEEATSGEIAFAGGGLRLSLTPAMTLFDVDGTLPPAELACAGAAAAGRAIRRMGIGGSIGVDLPTLAGKAERQAAAAALDAVLPLPFERTAVNGFGFLQIVRPRPRISLPELLRDDPVAAAARALLRRAERTRGAGTRTIVAAPAVVAILDAQADWHAALVRRLGSPLALRAQPALAISAGYVEAEHP
ncbi:MAG: hypothetical protein JWM38_1473 [Sphingomonas bacterium]|nr:hypothetical protein [Sphingomonas bacterium]